MARPAWPPPTMTVSWRSIRGLPGRLEGRQACNCAPHDQRVDVVRALIGVHRLEVRRVAHNLEFGRDAVAAVHVARNAGDLQRLTAIVAFDEADRLRNEFAGFEAASDAKRSLQSQCN